MKFSKHPANGRAGVALILVLVLVGVSVVILAGVLYRTQAVSLLNQHNASYAVAANAAEAAVEKVYARMAYDFQAYTLAAVYSGISSGMYRTNIPNAAENPYWSNFQFSDGRGNVGQTYVGFAYNYAGPLPSAFPGLFTITAPVYRIVSNVVSTNGGVRVVGTAQEDVLLALVPLTTWAIFYNGLLEFTQCADMSVNGPVMANGSIYVGTTASLVFNSGVNTVGTLTAPLVDGLTSGWTPGTPSTWKTTFKATPSYTTNVAAVSVSLAMTNSHFMIDIPPGGEAATSTNGAQRLYNKAQMVIIVTNDVSGSGHPTVRLTLQASVNGAPPGDDPGKTILTYTNASPALLSSNLPFLSLTNTFTDQRERKTALVSQIDVGTYSKWAATNVNVQGKLPASAGAYPTILYVADRRNVTASQLPVVRVKNAAQLPYNNGYGFTVATQNPLYTWGNYNTQTASSGANAAASTTNTTYTVPAALLADSLTVLSGNFTDSETATSYNNTSGTFDAADTTLNAAIIVGTVASTGSTDTKFSGGVHNLPRLLEDWSSKHLWLNTSILRLWQSNMGTNQFRNPQGFNPSPVNPYYNPPTRHYAYDLNFLDSAKVPPGIPTALIPIRFAWTVPPPNSVTNNPAHN